MHAQDTQVDELFGREEVFNFSTFMTVLHVSENAYMMKLVKFTITFASPQMDLYHSMGTECNLRMNQSCLCYLPQP